MGKLSAGLAAGAVGTTLLNAVTYLDMAVRGRPTSSVPDDDVDRMAERAGISLGDDPDKASARRTAIGALLGYMAGASIGAVYGLARPLAPDVPPRIAAVLVGLGAMAATDAASIAMGTTDPRAWSAADWASDVVPHLAFGWGVAVTYDALAGR
jgi:hypothetical protein